MKTHVDLNLDAGESAQALADGSEALLYDLVSSVNVACGGHAGDDQTMRASVRLAKARGLAIGAHPSYPDRAGFGRSALEMDPEVLRNSLRDQVRALVRILEQEHEKLAHIKPHGALYNVAASDDFIAELVVESCAEFGVPLVGLAGSRLKHACGKRGIIFRAEAFVDRRYEPTGQLRARKFADALIQDTDTAAAQALGIVKDGMVRAVDDTTLLMEANTLCIHGDTPKALQIATAVRRELDSAGVEIRALVATGRY